MSRHLPVLLLSLSVVAGCSSNPAKRLEVARQEAARMPAPSRSLSSWETFRVLPMETGPDIAGDEKKSAYAERLQGLLEEKIEPLFASWSTDETHGEGTLLVRADLVSLRVVSGGARFWAGAFAGDSEIDMNLVLTDAATGEVIASPRIERSAGGATGAWSVGKSDQNLLLYIADIAHEYLATNYRAETAAGALP